MQVSLHLVAVILRKLPLGFSLFFGKLLGWIWCYLIPIRKKLVRTQIARSLGLKPNSKEVSKISRKMFENLGQNLIEFLRIDPKHKETTLNLIEQKNMQRFYKAQQKGLGVLVLTAHFGNWDLLCCSQCLDNQPITILSKKIKPKWLNDYWMKTRSDCGLEILPDKHVKHELLDRLKNGSTIGFVIDQHMPGKSGVVVDFFDRPAKTSTGLARLALESKAPVIPIFLFRKPNGKHVMEVGREIEIVQGKSIEQSIALTTREYNKVLEQSIKRQPEMWLWLHRRWKVDG